jgi:hypothetical protein
LHENSTKTGSEDLHVRSQYRTGRPDGSTPAFYSCRIPDFKRRIVIRRLERPEKTAVPKWDSRRSAKALQNLVHFEPRFVESLASLGRMRSTVTHISSNCGCFLIALTQWGVKHE